MTKGEPQASNLRRGAIAWMAQNRVAPHMLMLFLLIGGIIIALQMKKQIWPAVSADMVTVQVSYPGANPTEVEEGILLSLEDGLRGIQGVNTILTNAYDQFAMATIMISPSENPFKVFQDIKNAIDRIVTFSTGAERPVVQLYHYGDSQPLMSIVVYGAQSIRAIHSLSERVQDDLIASPDVGGIQLSTAPTYEMSIEIPIMMLRAYNLTLDGVAATIRESSENVPAGEIYAKEGKIILQSIGRKNSEIDFASIPVTTTPDGTVIRLGDIASINDDFIEHDVNVRYNGLPAASLFVFQTSKNSPQQVSDAVHRYINQLKPELPPNTHVEVLTDSSHILSDRLRMLRLDAIAGMLLVTIFLGLSFEVRVAFWVAMCIPVAISGAFLLIPFFDVSINLISVCAFLVAVGIIIDNGVVMGERIYAKREEALNYLEAAQAGAQEIALPVLFAVSVNSLGFLPMLLFSGESGRYFSEIPLIAISIFGISLIQTLFILPSQLAVRPKHHQFLDVLNRPKLLIHEQIQSFIAKVYIPLVHRIIRFRYHIVASAVGLLVFALWILSIGFVPYTPFPAPEQEEVTITADIPQSALDEDVLKIADQIMQRTEEFVTGAGQGMVGGILRTTNSGGGVAAGAGGAGQSSTGNTIKFQMSLLPRNERTMPVTQFEQSLRAYIGNPLGVTSLSVGYFGDTSGEQINISLSHRSSKQLESAARDIAHVLSSYHGVSNIDNGLVRGKRQFNFQLLPAARSIGITSSELGRQMRAAFYGTEAIRKQRGRNQVSVMVRLPRSERSDLDTLNKLIIRSPEGQEMFLSQAAMIKEGTSPSIIQRANGLRQLSIRAHFADERLRPTDIIQSFKSDELPRILQRYPGLTVSFPGDVVEEAGGVSPLIAGFLFVLLFIYTLLAILFKSYIQPLVILVIIPFEIIGPIFGHLYFGYEFSYISLFGVLALTGIVVNAASMMVVTANDLHVNGFSPLASIRLALINRFRAVMLTAIATFLAMTPFLFEMSPDARAIVPMTVSLGVGAVFSIVISLALVPALYLISQDIERALKAKIRKIEETGLRGILPAW